MPSTNEILKDLQIQHQIIIQKMVEGEQKEALKLLAATEKDVIKQIAKLKPGATKKHLQAVLAGVRNIRINVHKEISAKLKVDLQELAAYESEWQTAMLAENLPLVIEPHAVSAERVAAAARARPFQGDTLNNWALRWGKGDLQALEQAINIGYVEGETATQIMQRVRNSAFPKTRRSLMSVVNTTLNHTANVARQQVAEANEDVIKGVQWLATLDQSTTPICQARDGEVFPIDKGPRPPAHFNCRSTIVYVTKSWKELGIKGLDEVDPGTRASMNGQVGAKETYQSWLKKQPEGFVVEVLGQKKAALFLKGGLPLKKFVNEQGQTLTLAQLRIKHPVIWKKALGHTPPVKKPKPLTPKQVIKKAFKQQTGTGDPLAYDWDDLGVLDDDQKLSIRPFMAESYKGMEQHYPALKRFRLPQYIAEKGDGSFCRQAGIKMGDRHLNGSRATGQRLKDKFAESIWRHEHGHYMDYELAKRRFKELKASGFTAVEARDASGNLHDYRCKFSSSPDGMAALHSDADRLIAGGKASFKKIKETAIKEGYLVSTARYSPKNMAMATVCRGKFGPMAQAWEKKYGQEKWFLPKDEVALSLRTSRSFEWAEQQLQAAFKADKTGFLEKAFMELRHHAHDKWLTTESVISFVQHAKDGNKAGLLTWANNSVGTQSWHWWLGNDYVGSLTKNKIGYGHGTKYYTAREMVNSKGFIVQAGQGTEAFANANALHGDEMGRAMLEYFGPDFYKFYQEAMAYGAK